MGAEVEGLQTGRLDQEPAADDGLLVEAVLLLVPRTGIPWHDLPERLRQLEERAQHFGWG